MVHDQPDTYPTRANVINIGALLCVSKKSSFKIDNKDEQLTILAILFIRGVLGFDLAL